ncbi:MAG: hypothetical protein WKF88_11555 [Ferruginibacter sp.]
MNRKIKADNIFTGQEFTGPGHVLTLDENGVILGITDEVSAGEGVEVAEGILCPGFVNAHCHIELSHLENKIPRHTGLVSFVQEVLKQRTTSPRRKAVRYGKGCRRIIRRRNRCSR